MQAIQKQLKQDLKDFDPKKIKAVAIDIDGTLINEKSICTPRTIKAVKDLIKTGREVYIVTGRAVSTAMSYALQVDIPKYMINCNGAVIWDFKAQKKVLEKSIALSEITIIADKLREYQLMAFFYTEDTFYYEIVNGYLEQYMDRVTIKGHKKDLKTVDLESIQKIFVMGEEEKIKQFYKELQEQFAGKVTAFMTTPGMHNLANPDTPARCIEIMASNVNKGSTLQELLAKHDITMDEVVSFGDDTNDVEMIQMSTWGVAMNNARQTVKDVARLETLSHEEDGVAYFIENYLLG